MKQSFYTSQANWQKLHDYAQVAYDKHKSEIGGMLVAVEDETGDWSLEDPVILKQEISMSNCVLDKDALALYYTKAGVKYKDFNFRFVWWHSHHTMDAFWSGTDITAIKEYSDGDFSFALVINLKGKHIFRVSSWKPFEMHIDTKVELLDGEERKIPKKILNDVDKLCNKRVVSYQYGKTTKYPGNGWHNPNQTSLMTTDISSDKEAARAIELITSLNFRFAAGEITFKEWERIVSDYNHRMDDWYIDDVTTEEQLAKDVIHRKSEDFIEPLYTPQERLENKQADDAKEEWYFNQTYGGY